jgi:hypothetical protein
MRQTGMKPTAEPREQAKKKATEPPKPQPRQCLNEAAHKLYR